MPHGLPTWSNSALTERPPFTGSRAVSRFPEQRTEIRRNSHRYLLAGVPWIVAELIAISARPPLSIGPLSAMSSKVRADAPAARPSIVTTHTMVLRSALTGRLSLGPRQMVWTDREIGAHRRIYGRMGRLAPPAGAG